MPAIRDARDDDEAGLIRLIGAAIAAPFVVLDPLHCIGSYGLG